MHTTGTLCTKRQNIWSFELKKRLSISRTSFDKQSLASEEQFKDVTEKNHAEIAKLKEQHYYDI